MCSTIRIVGWGTVYRPEVSGAEKPVLRPVLIVSLALIVLASGFVVVLGPARFHPPAFNAVGRPSPPLPTTPVIGQGVHGYASIGPLFPLCTVVGVLGPVPDNIKSVHVIVITSSGERILSQIDWMPSMTCNFVSARPARIAPGPAAVGTFSVNLAPGNYGVTMSNCDSIGQALGCEVFLQQLSFPRGSMLDLILLLTQELGREFSASRCLARK